MFALSVKHVRMKFQYINNKAFALELIPKLIELGYKLVENYTTGGDNDKLIIDTDAKTFAWFEQGFSPYADDLSYFKDKSLSDLFSMRYKN